MNACWAYLSAEKKTIWLKQMQYNRMPYGRLHRIMWFLNGCKGIFRHFLLYHVSVLNPDYPSCSFSHATKTILCNTNHHHFSQWFFLIKRNSSCYCLLLLGNLIKTSKARVIKWVAKVNSAYHCLIRQSKICIMLENWKGEEGESHNHFTCINIFCHKFTDKLN